MKKCLMLSLPLVFAAGPLSAQILLIEDQGGFGTLAAKLEATGYDVTEVNNEYLNSYANLLDGDFLDDFNLVIYGERGAQYGNLLPATVATSLEGYLQGGGNLLVTGYDSLGSPVDANLGGVVRASSPGDQASYDTTWVVTSLDHPIVNGPFGDFRGQTFTAGGYDDDSLTPDIGAGAIELISTGSPRVTGRLIFTDLPGAAGAVGYWNGGNSGTTTNAQPDFTSPDEPGDILLNYLAFIEGLPAPGIAGPDLEMADVNGDNQVSLILDGSYATTLGTIVSWEWTWSGTSASGEFVEITFPATNEPVTVKLTVTDDLGNESIDFVKVTIYEKEKGLFTEFKSPDYIGISGASSDYRVFATIEGDTLVIDPRSTQAPPEVYRKVAGVWTPSTFTESVTDLRAVAPDTLVSGDFINGTGFKIHKLVGSTWNTSSVSLSTPVLSHRDHSSYVVGDGVFLSTDLFNDTYANNAGRVFAYDWAGTDWTHQEPLPTGGLLANQRWGEAAGAEDGLLAIIDLNQITTPPSRATLKLFENVGGTWTYIDAFAPDDGFSEFMSYVGVDGGTVVAQKNSFPRAPVVLENTGSSWVQTVLPLHPAVPDNLFYYGFHVDDDGNAFAAYDINGTHVVYEKDIPAADWSDTTQTVSQRRLLVKDLISSRDLMTTDFSDGQSVVCDAVRGVVRIFDRSAPFDTANAEPVADAGNDIQTTSFDGSPVTVFLSGGNSLELNYDDTLTAVWTWDGGSATGLQTFASIDPSVTTIELTLTDSRGAISRDTVSIDIQAPPVVDPGTDMIVVDTDGDDIIRANVSATIVSSDSPVASYNWRWPGGTFGDSAGIIQLGPDADGNSVILETIDSNGLSSESEFTFSLLHPNPTPTVLEAFDSSPEAEFGIEADINDDFALIGAIRDLSGGVYDNSAYLGVNTNGIWNQVPINPPGEVGTAVQIDDDYAFVGAARMDGDALPGTGRVFVLERQGNNYVPVQTLIPSSINGNLFGWSLARSGNRLVVGDIGLEAAFIFELSGGTWTEVQRIDTPEASPGISDDFGDKVAIHGDSLAIALPGAGSSASVCLYEWTGTAGQFSFDKQLLPDIPASPIFRNQNTDEGDFFGTDIAMDETNLIIGNPRHDEAYHYTRAGGSWNSTADGKLFGNQDFGRSVSMLGEVLVVGTNRYNVSGPPRTLGAATVYHLINGVWTEVDEILGPDPGESIVTYHFGYDVNHDGRDLIVGAPAHRNDSGFETGLVYVYRNYAALNPNANYEPIASAGGTYATTDSIVRDGVTDEIIEPLGSEVVTLDGSGSTDQEDGIVSWEWTWDSSSASGEIVNARFPVGTTTVTLTVTDNMGIINTDVTTVTVTLNQTAPAALASTAGNTFTVDLPVAGARWRLSNEFLWHDSMETITGIVPGETYQVEVIGFPGSTEVITALATPLPGDSVADFNLILPLPAGTTGTISFPETEAGFSARLQGGDSWWAVTDNGDATEDVLSFTLPTGQHLIEFKPVDGYITPSPRVITVSEGVTLGLNWGDYALISNFDNTKTFDLASSPDLEGDPYQFVGMIRTPLGRATGTVVADRVVLTAAHPFFNFEGLKWENTQWFPRQQQDTYQAPPVAPRGILFRTSYAKLIAPDSIPGTVANLPEDIQEVDFACLYFNDATWTGGSANFLQSTADQNWLTGPENKHAVGYSQRNEAYPERGMIFEKTFTTPLTGLDSLGKLYESSELFGSGGASGSCLWIEPAGTGQFYPAGILLAGSNRAVYRKIDLEVTRMIKDAADTATGNGDVLDSSSSLVTFDSLGSFATLGVSIAPSEIQSSVRWSVTPNAGAGFANIESAQTVPFNPDWDDFTLSFNAVPGYATPDPVSVEGSTITPSTTTTYTIVYEPLSGYDTWKQDNLLSSDEANGDGDAWIALWEYALDLDPGLHDFREAIRPAASPTQTTYAEFEVYLSATADAIQYEVVAADTADDLENGTNLTSLGTFTKADGASDYLTVTDTQPISASQTRFARVIITHDRNLSAP